MPARISNEEAVSEMLRAELTPLEDYKNSTTPWACICIRCNNKVTPTLATIRRGSGGCVYCAGLVVTEESAVNLFKLNNLAPLVPYPGAGKPWKSIHLTCGREVSPSYSNVRTGHSGCKYCVGNIKDEEKARKLFISKGLIPLEPYVNAKKPWKSIHRECGKEVSPNFNTVQQGSSGCQFCAGNAPLNKKEAEELFQKAGLKPLEPFQSTGRPWLSIHLKCGREVSPSYSSVKAGGSGCKFCAGIYIDPLEASSELRKLGFEPLTDYPGSNIGWTAIHNKCGRVVKPNLGLMRKGSSGCAFCSRNRVDPDVAKALFLSKGLIPQVEFPGGKLPWPSIHAKCGSLVSPKYADVSIDSNGCKKCAPNYVDPEEALEIFRAANLEPLEPYPGANRGWKSKHLICGREVTPRFGYVRRNNAGCAYCAGKLVDPQEAKYFMESQGLVPVEEYPGAQTPWRCVHRKCGREVTPTYNGVRWSNNGGCKYCADSTFNYADPAVLYLITNEELSAHKIGIGNQKKKRVEQHIKHGWKIYKTLDLNSGEEAYRIEQEFLNWLQGTLGLMPFLSKDEMPQGGFTETFDATELDLPTAWGEISRLASSTKS